ncbi:MAG: hypothetical protein LBU51_03105 [Bacteroidales bacterium]|jgi:hypothetical protein|nr:hypothetical protein [Bacteroidales bacterium]
MALLFQVSLTVNFNIVNKKDKFFDKLGTAFEIGTTNYAYYVLGKNRNKDLQPGVVKINGEPLKEAMLENPSKSDITAGIKKALAEIINPTEKVLSEMGVSNHKHLTEKKEYR